MSTRLVWLRDDLRLHDHPALNCASSAGDRVVAAAVVDPAWHEATDLGFPRRGAHWLRFRLEALRDLRARIRARGGDLVIRVGDPVEQVATLSQEIEAVAIHATAAICSEERAQEDRLRGTSWGRALELHQGHSLLHPDDLPMAVEDLPGVFTPFRKKVEKQWRVRAAVAAPVRLDSLPHGLDPGAVPRVEDFGLVAPAADPRAPLEFEGGESAALDRLQHYLWRTDRVARYKRTRNGMLGADYSTKFSPWLAHGCLSPRLVHQEIRRYEAERTKNDSTYWVIFELLWRDFFRFHAQKYGDAIFHPEGTAQVARPWSRDRDRFRSWTGASTGEPFVDANMTELQRTGFMSNRGRQSVASHLIHELGIDWTWGARWFESKLIDDDAHSNWGNWAYIAGVGSDPRGGRRFDLRGQAKRYDPNGEYVRTWIDSAPPTSVVTGRRAMEGNE